MALSLVVGLLMAICAMTGPPALASAAQTTATSPARSAISAPAPVATVNSAPISPATGVPYGGLKAGLIFALFLGIAGGIATRRIPAMVALPLMALGIGLIAGAPLLNIEDAAGKVVPRGDGVLNAVIEGRRPPAVPSPQGAFRIYDAIVYTLFGGMFARFIADAKIAERIVKYAAEFGGEDPFAIALLMSCITVLIFTAVGGLPMIIMLGTVMFPILLSLGVPAVTCGCLLLLAFPLGTSLQPVMWATQASVFGLPIEPVRNYYLVWTALQAAMLLAFLCVEFLRMKRTTVTFAGMARSVAWVLAAVLGLVALGTFEHAGRWFPAADPALRAAVGFRDVGLVGLRWGVTAMLAFGIVHTQWVHLSGRTVRSQWNLLTPILPLVFLLLLGFQSKSSSAIIPAFLASMAYGYLTTPGERAMQKLGRSIINGVSDVAAPVVLFIGIGMLLAVAALPQVSEVLTPIIRKGVPTNAVAYVIVFFLASPLSLYRGPLNQFGLGLGVAQLIRDTGIIPPGAVMGAINATGMLQDPTATQNVWVCGYLKLDINALLFKLLTYSAVLVLAGLLLSVAVFFR